MCSQHPTGDQIVKIEQYQTIDGNLFNTVEAAQQHCEEIKRDKQKQLEVDEAKREKQQQMIEACKKLYFANEWPDDKCNCYPIGFSSECLVHLCTCDAGICDRHTSLYFKNKGCFWCGYTDCSKYGC